MTTILSYQSSGWRLQLVDSVDYFSVYLNRRLVLRGSITECLDCFKEYVDIATQVYYPSKFKNVKNDAQCQK